jgi:penicillin-binding protein 1A
MYEYLKSLSVKIRSFFKSKSGRWIFTRLVFGVISLAGLLVLMLIILVWAGMFGKLPGRKELTHINHPIASEVYSADSVLLGRYFVQERSFTTPEEIPESLKKTLVATEDVRFYNHHGIDYRSLGRVIAKSVLLQRESSGGGSTITQQLAKNLYPRRSLGFLSMPVNKIREFIIAWRLENVYSKEEILTLYLNTIPFADNTYGIETAADRFFSVAVKNLRWDQSAVLVGMLKATHRYNPRLFPERALSRRNLVLAQLRKYDMINERQMKDFQALPLALRYNFTSHNKGLAPYFRAYIQQALEKWCRENRKADGTPYNLYTDGLKIYTTVDSRLQGYAEEAMRSQMKELQRKFEGQIGKKQLDALTRSAVSRLPIYRAMVEEGFSQSRIQSRVREVTQTKIFTWDGERELKMSIYDSVKHHLQFLQAGLMAMNPHNGQILAWVGGIDHEYFKYDHVRESTKRQVGSTFKPIVYGAAIESGIGPCSYISARKTVYTNMDDWAPENSNENTYDRKYSMEGGLSGSVNTVSVKLIEQAGVGNAIAIARKMGIKSKLPAVPSIALGTPSISVEEMVAAYSVFANNGNYSKPRYLLAIADREGQLLSDFKTDEKPLRAISRETALMMIHMLQSVVTSGTGSSLRTKYGLTNDIAGKTGTTQSNVDGWFMAITPDLVIGSWVGADDPRLHFMTTALGQGAATALPIVAKFIQRANNDAHLRGIMNQRFDPLPQNVLDKLDCAESKSDLNLFQRIFKKKKKVKVARFKIKKSRESI